MKIGFLLIATPATAPPAMVARKAEAVGFESFWLPEHPSFPESFATRHQFSADGEEVEGVLERLAACAGFPR